MFWLNLQIIAGWKRRRCPATNSHPKDTRIAGLALLSAVVRLAHYPAQALLDAKTHRKKMTHDFTYSGIITCGHCGCSMVAELKKGRYVSSHCTNGKGTKCPEPYTREEILTKELTGVRGEPIVRHPGWIHGTGPQKTRQPLREPAGRSNIGSCINCRHVSCASLRSPHGRLWPSARRRRC